MLLNTIISVIIIVINMLLIMLLCDAAQVRLSSGDPEPSGANTQDFYFCWKPNPKCIDSEQWRLFRFAVLFIWTTSRILCDFGPHSERIPCEWPEYCNLGVS